MEKQTVAKAVAAIISGLATVVSTVWAINVDWLSPEFTVTLGTAIGALLVYLVPNKPVEVVEDIA